MRTKIITAWLLIIIMLMGLKPPGVLAAAYPDWDSPWWDGEYKVNSTTIFGYKGSGGDLVLPRTEVIFPEVFLNKDTIQSVVLPNNLITIGNNAFSYCDNIKTIVVPDSTKYIQANAFGQCTNLNHVVLGNSVEFLGAGTFQDCTNLKTVIFTGYVPPATIEYGLFLKVPTGLKIIVPYGTKNAYETALAGHLPTGSEIVYSLPESLFTYDLATGMIIGYNQSGGSYAAIPSKINGYTVKGIAASAFQNNSRLTGISIPSSVSTISPDAFKGCSSLTFIRVDIDSSHFCEFNGALFNKEKTTLYTYSRNNGITVFIVPATVTCVHAWAFYYNPSLKYIRFKSVQPPSFVENSFEDGINNGWNGLYIYVPQVSFQAYKNALPNFEHNTRIYVGSDKSELVSITVPGPILGLANGTAKTASALGLPPTVTLVTDGGNVSGDVTWALASSSYNPSSTTEQTFTVDGTVNLPVGVTNPGSIPLKVTISVTVDAITTMVRTLMSVVTPAAIIGVVNGTADTASALGLPSTISLVTDGGNVPASVSWIVHGCQYNPSLTVEQSFTVDGTLTLPSDVVNTNSVSLNVTINVTVLAAASMDKTLVSVVTPAAIIGVVNGTAKTSTGLGLPNTVTLITNNGNVSASVNWNVDSSSYNPSLTSTQTFIVDGTVTLPSGVVNTNGVDLTVTLSITVNAAPIVPAYTITASVTRGGSISPSGALSVTKGDSKTFTITPAPGYRISMVTVDGVNQGDVSLFTFHNVTTSHIINATFVATSGNGGGSSDGGGSSGGGGSTSPNPTIAPDKNLDQPVIAASPLTPTVNKRGNATITIPLQTITDIINQATTKADKQGKTANGIGVSLLMEKPSGTKTLSIIITQLVLNQLTEAKIQQFEIDGGLLSINFDLEALKQIQSQSSDNLTISITPATGLSKRAKALIGTRTVYNITLSYVKGGKTVNITSVGKGSITLSIPYTPGKNEAVGYLFGVYVNSKGKSTRINGSTYDANSKSIIFNSNHFSVYGVGYAVPSVEFTDITSHWAKESIDYVVGCGLFSGTSDTIFSPDIAMSRGILATILGRLAGADVSGYKKSSFSDVKTGSTFLPYIEWAYKKGIMQGISDYQFDPDRAVTREEIALVLQNYAKATDYILPVTRKVVNFADTANISSIVSDAVMALQQAGIIMSKQNNRFNPKESATRAEIATMLHRYIKLTINPTTALGWAKNDDGQWYHFNADGSQSLSTTVDGYELDEQGVRKEK